MFETLFTHVPIGILVVDSLGEIRTANPAAHAMFGYQPQELEGKPIDLLVPLRSRSTHAAHRDAYHGERTARRMGADRELLALRKDGTELPVEVGLFPSPEGTEIFVTVIDISVRQEARRQLFYAQQINKTGSWSFDLERGQVLWSPEIFRILQLPVAHQAPLFETHHQLFTAASWARLKAAVETASREGIPYELELELAGSDKLGPRIAVARCQPQRDAEGKVVRLLGTFQDVTDLVRVRRQRDEILERLTLAQAAAGLGIWQWDLDSNELLWDARMYELYGLPNRPVTYRDWQAAVHSADLAATEAHLRDVVAGGGEFHHQFRIQHPEGERHLLAAAAVVGNGANAHRRMVGVNMDITASVRVQEGLRKRDAELALVLHSVPDAVFTVTMPNRTIEFVSDAVESVLGYLPQELIGGSTRRLYPTDELFQSFGRRLGESLARGDARFASEVLLRHKNGAELHCEITVSFKKEANQLVAAIASVRSIEDRWRAERALHERQEQWNRFAAATSNMLWNWNFADDSVERNVAFQTAFGYAADQVLPTIEWWVERLHAEDRQRVLSAFEQALETGLDTTGYTYRFRRRDGTYATIRDRVFILRDDDGRAYRALGAMTDITEQARREEAAIRANNLESLGLLAGGIAHDFNNQLTSMLAAAELLELDAGDPVMVRVLAQQIGTAVENAARLTRQLLTFSRGGAPSRQAVSIEEVVRENVTFSLRGSSTQVALVFEDALWSANVDPGQIGQVIQNLVLNADQAMGKNGTLRVEARNCVLPAEPPRRSGGRFIELRVTDSGPGIADSVLPRIFDPYFTTKPKGHGLGLSICHSIVERHHGSIQVESVLGEGTTFIVRLPAAQDVAPARDRVDALALGAGRILIVDDIDEVRGSITQILEALGYWVTAAAGVDDAVAAFRLAGERGQPYDVVLTDLTIPGTGGGLDVLRRLRAIDPSVRVVVASGYANDPILANHEAHGFNAKLTKPIRLRALSSVLANLLGTR